MKVVQVLPRLHGGGVERGTIEIAGYLRKLGHEAIVISEGGPLVDELTAFGVIHISMAVGTKNLRVLRGIWQLRKYFNDARPEIVHSRSRLPGWLCYLAIKLLPNEARPRFVTSVHGLHSVSRYSAIIAKGERIEAVSTAAEQYLLENYRNFDRNRVRVIHRGVDPSVFNTDFEPDSEWKRRWSIWKKEHSIDEDSPVVTIVGRVSRLKGHHDFLDVIESLFEQSTPVTGIIVGEASKEHHNLYEELRLRVEKVEALRKSVFFLGHRSDVRELMVASDVLVSFSSTPEAFGRTVLEALSLGVPVVGYDHGGVRDLLRELCPIGAVPVGDTGSAAARIRTLISQKHEISRHSMTLQAMREKTISMYEELLS